VTPRERWQALQTQLRLSRSHLDQGNFAAALEAVDGALALDPNFLAALSLRGRIMSLAPDLPVVPASPLPQAMPSRAEVGDVASVAAEPLVAEAANRNGADVASTAVPIEMPLVSAAVVAEAIVPVDAADDLPLQVPPVAAAGPSRPPVDNSVGSQPFEHRTRRRRADRGLDAVRASLAAGRLKEAASALDEVIELDPNLPELRELAAQYASLKKNLRRPRAGRWLAAAAAFGGVMLGASWLQDATGLWSRQTVGVSLLVAPPPPLTMTVSASAVEPEPDELTGTSGSLAPASQFHATEGLAPERPIAEALDRRDVHPNETATALAENVTSLPQAQPPPVVRASGDMAAAVGVLSEPPANAVAPIGPATAVSAPPPAASPSSAVVRQPDDQVKISQVLQRYRAAYDSLDAGSARAVWPSVNEAALARAFDGLASQRLVFDGCDVRLRGDAAADVTCHGTTRYIPKIGNRDPRVEPRTWNFTLRRSGADWNIVSARAER
jgi:hypothetical protein